MPPPSTNMHQEYSRHNAYNPCMQYSQSSVGFLASTELCAEGECLTP